MKKRLAIGELPIAAPDSPFTPREIVEFKAMIYAVNTGHHCLNVLPFDYAQAWQTLELLEQENNEKQMNKEQLQALLDYAQANGLNDAPLHQVLEQYTNANAKTNDNEHNN